MTNFFGNLIIDKFLERVFLFLFCLIPVPDRAIAQPAAQQEIQTQDTLKIQYKLSSRASLAAGNLESFTSSNRLDFSAIDTVLGFSTHNTYRYGTLNGNQLYNEFYSKDFLFLYPKRRLYYIGIGTIEKSLLREYDLRWWAGLGAGFYILKKTSEYLVTTLSVIHEHTDFNGNEFVGDETTSNIRNVRRITFRFLGLHSFMQAKMMFRHETWYQVNVSNAGDFRFQTFITLEFPVSHLFSLAASLEYSYESVILRGREHGDLLLSFGVSFGNN